MNDDQDQFDQAETELAALRRTILAAAFVIGLSIMLSAALIDHRLSTFIEPACCFDCPAGPVPVPTITPIESE